MSRIDVQNQLRRGANYLPLVIVAGVVALGAALLLAGGSRAVGASSLLETLLPALVGLVATLGYLVVFVALHVLPTGYSPIRHAVSDYAVGRYGYLFRIGLGLSSIGVAGIAVAIATGVGSPPIGARDLVYLLLIPAVRVGMSLFPTDVEGRRLSRTGLVHYGFAIAAFTLTYLVITETTPVLQDLGPTWLSSPLVWTAAAVTPALAMVVITMLPPLRKVFGLFERVFLLTTNVWFVLVALLLILPTT